MGKKKGFIIMHSNWDFIGKFVDLSPLQGDLLDKSITKEQNWGVDPCLGCEYVFVGAEGNTEKVKIAAIPKKWVSVVN